MALVLILRPAGLFGKEYMRKAGIIYALAGLFALCVPILGIYPIFMMKLLCFAMFACAFNLLLGFSECCLSAMPLFSGPLLTQPAGW